MDSSWANSGYLRKRWDAGGVGHVGTKSGFISRLFWEGPATRTSNMHVQATSDGSWPRLLHAAFWGVILTSLSSRPTSLSFLTPLWVIIPCPTLPIPTLYVSGEQSVNRPARIPTDISYSCVHGIAGGNNSETALISTLPEKHLRTTSLDFAGSGNSAIVPLSLSRARS